MSSVAGPFYIKHVRVQEEPGIGLIGFQLCWETDGQAVEGRQWGEWTSGRRHGFRVPDGEFVVRLEFMHNNAVESIRWVGPACMAWHGMACSWRYSELCF
jgi:hypothetical protein